MSGYHIVTKLARRTEATLDPKPRRIRLT